MPHGEPLGRGGTIVQKLERSRYQRPQTLHLSYAELLEFRSMILDRRGAPWILQFEGCLMRFLMTRGYNREP